MVDENVVIGVSCGEVREGKGCNIGVGYISIVSGNVTRKCGARLAKQCGLVDVVDDGLSSAFSEELVDDASIGKLKSKHLRNKAGATDGKDGDDIGIGKPTQPERPE